MPQKERDTIMTQFRSGQTRVLISTDLWGRGLDVQQAALYIQSAVKKGLKSCRCSWKKLEGKHCWSLGIGAKKGRAHDDNSFPRLRTFSAAVHVGTTFSGKQ
eukprot:3277395-Amphidinium_carterae.1